MPIPSHLLERAYQLINANQFQNAELVLDAVVRVEPQNVGAWKTYMQIHQNQNDLDWLIERVLKTIELTEADKTELLNFYNLLTQQLNGTKKNHIQTSATGIPLQEKVASRTSEKDAMISFELIDVFDYPIKIIKKEPHTKPRQRAVYKTFLVDIAKGMLKAMSRDSFWKQTAVYIEKAIADTSRFVKSPKDTLNSYINSRHSKTSLGITMLALFILGMRLFISGYFLGYVLLGLFVLTSGWWLLNSESHTISQNRVYLHKDVNNLPAEKSAKIEQNQESDEDDFWKVDQ